MPNPNAVCDPTPAYAANASSGPYAADESGWHAYPTRPTNPDTQGVGKVS